MFIEGVYKDEHSKLKSGLRKVNKNDFFKFFKDIITYGRKQVMLLSY